MVGWINRLRQGLTKSKVSKDIAKRNKASKELLEDDGGPYVRRQKHNAKKAKEKGTVYNKSGHAVGTPSKTPGGRTRESIKKYHGLHKDYKGKYESK